MVSFKGMLCGRFILMGIKAFHTPRVYEPGPAHYPGLTWGCERSLQPQNTIRPINSSMKPQGLSTPTFPMPQLHLKAKAPSLEPCQLWTALSLCYSVLLFLLPLKKKKNQCPSFPQVNLSICAEFHLLLPPWELCTINYLPLTSS